MDEYLDLAGKDLTGKGTAVASGILPLPKSDTTWNHLAKNIPSSSFVFSSVHSPAKPQADLKKREQQQDITFGFSLKVCDDYPEVAKAAGLFFTDRTTKKGEQYMYRVEIITLSGAPVSGVGAADEKQSQLFAVQNPAGQFRNRKMRISFDVTQTRDQYAGYIIERSEDSVLFTRVNETLLSFVKSQYETDKRELTYEDSLPRNGKRYWYRVRGYSFFGMEGPPSATIRGKGKEEWNAYPVPDTCYSPDNKRVIISWTMPALSDNSLLEGVVVLRNEKVNGKYASLTKDPIAATTFTDTAASFTNYYLLAAISTEGDTAFSFPVLAQLQDNDPPAIPTELKGVIDTNGIVKLNWAAVASPDLKGYRVFRCNTLREEFAEISDSVITVTVFTDTITLQTLTPDVYYSVRSVDHVWNNSEFSPPMKLRRPDKIAPVSPVIKSIYHTDTTVVLSWINSSSKDITEVHLYRKQPGKEVTLLALKGNDTTSHFVDTSAEAGTVYTYRLVVMDSSGNYSLLVFPQMNFSPRVRPALKNFTGTADLEKRTITLNWDLPSTPVDRVIIYKGKQGEILRSFKTLSGATTQYVDNQLYPGNAYVYRVKAIMKDGVETKLVEIKVVF